MLEAISNIVDVFFLMFFDLVLTFMVQTEGLAPIVMVHYGCTGSIYVHLCVCERETEYVCMGVFVRAWLLVCCTWTE